MLRWRTAGVREVLLVFLLLNATQAVLIDQLPGLEPGKPNLTSALLGIFLTWRVYRGGRISHAFLLVGAAAGYLRVVLAVARFWNPLLAVLAVTCAAQFLLLISPQVRARLERQTELTGWAGIATGLRRPPAWLVIGGVLAGVLVTMALLGNMDWVPVPGCAPATSDACTALAEGYPLRWLTAVQNIPLIHKGALAKDCVQWTVVAWSLLYAVWNWMLPRPDGPARSSASAPTVG